MAAGDSEVGFLNCVFLELNAERSLVILIEREQQDAGSWFVQSVAGIDALPYLVAEDLQGKACLVSVDGATVYQQAGGFVNSDDIVIVIEKIQGVFQRRAGEIYCHCRCACTQRSVSYSQRCSKVS